MRPHHELAAILALIPLATAGTYSQVTNFGSNPSNVGMYIYVPSNLASNPPVVVVPHACHGSASDAYNGSPYRYQADIYGFLVLYPDSPNTADKCWDVSSSQSLSHNGGGDSLGIVSAVKYTISKYNANARRVFVTGTSSGAMMTNVLLGAYPDVFAAGSAWAGVAFGCFAGNGVDVWNGDCATGVVQKTGAQWKAIVQAAYPGYTGYRPKFQVFHGSVDTVLYPQNLKEEVKEWTAVFGLSETPTQVLSNTPLSGWTKSVYGTAGTFEATLATGVDHNIQTQTDTVMAFFDLKCTGTNCFSRPDGGSTNPTTTTQKTTTTTQKATTTTTKLITTSSSAGGGGSGAPHWGQCGGIGWTGPTTCVSPYTCQKSNDWYSQCL